MPRRIDGDRVAKTKLLNYEAVFSLSYPIISLPHSNYFLIEVEQKTGTSRVMAAKDSGGASGSRLNTSLR